MVEIIQVITVVSTIVLITGGIYTIRDQIKKSKEDSQRKIIEAIKQEINPMKIEAQKDKEALQVSLEAKQEAINDLWKDLESLEDHLNKVQIQVAHNTGVIDTQTPLINEIRAQIELLRAKIDMVRVEK